MGNNNTFLSLCRLYRWEREKKYAEDWDNNMMPDFLNFNEKFNCKNVTFFKHVAIENNFEICGKLSKT